MNKELIMNPNQLVAFLEKPCAEFTKEDIKRYIQQNGMYRFMSSLVNSAQGFSRNATNWLGSLLILYS